MTGTVLHSDNPDYPKGEEVVFAAPDNTNSSIFHFDIITPLFLSFEKFNGNCHGGLSRTQRSFEKMSGSTTLQYNQSRHMNL